eukprot:m.361570 g.361570  ORF g.361570 m.361570 type:complete len:511 (-) comp16644_c0_seq89:410-1942(-)
MSRCRVDTTCTGCALRSRSRAMDAALTSVGGIQPTWNSGTSMANSRSWSAIEKNECLLAVQELLLPDCDICDHVLHDDDKYVMPCGCEFHRACVEERVKWNLECPSLDCIADWKLADIQDLNPIKEDEFERYRVWCRDRDEDFQTYQDARARFEELKDDPFEGLFGDIEIDLCGFKMVGAREYGSTLQECTLRRRWYEIEMSYPRRSGGRQVEIDTYDDREEAPHRLRFLSKTARRKHFGDVRITMRTVTENGDTEVIKEKQMELEDWLQVGKMVEVEARKSSYNHAHGKIIVIDGEGADASVKLRFEQDFNLRRRVIHNGEEQAFDVGFLTRYPDVDPYAPDGDGDSDGSQNEASSDEDESDEEPWIVAMNRMEFGIYDLVPGIRPHEHGTLKNYFIGQALEKRGIAYADLDHENKEDYAAFWNEASDLLEASTQEERQAILDAKKAALFKPGKVQLRRINPHDEADEDESDEEIKVPKKKQEELQEDEPQNWDFCFEFRVWQADAVQN